jgi:hypothetical protein
MDSLLKIHSANGPNIYMQAITNNNGNSRYMNHILSTRHTYGSITDTMNIILT